jgi:hypothetical protein
MREYRQSGLFLQLEEEKNLNHESLFMEVKRMWNVKYNIMPVIIGAILIVSNVLEKNVEAMQGKQSVESLHSTAIRGASHIIWKVLQP